MSNFILIEPMGKPRMTQRDRWAHRPVIDRYYTFCDELRLKYTTPLPDCLSLTFHIAMPASWSKRKKEAMCGQPHQQKPDSDNLAKSVMDALCKDDARIYKLFVEKYWATQSGILIKELV